MPPHPPDPCCHKTFAKNVQDGAPRASKPSTIKQCHVIPSPSTSLRTGSGASKVFPGLSKALVTARLPTDNPSPNKKRGPEGGGATPFQSSYLRRAFEFPWRTQPQIHEHWPEPASICMEPGLYVSHLEHVSQVHGLKPKYLQKHTIYLFF